MPIRTHHWLGAAGIGAAAAWVQKRQKDTGKSLFGDFLSKIGITQDGVAIALFPALVEAVPDLQRMVPPEYRQAFEGAVDGGLSIAAMALAKDQGFGEIPTTMVRIRTAAPARVWPTRAMTRTAATTTFPPVVPSVARPSGEDLSDSLTASAW